MCTTNIYIYRVEFKLHLV